MARNSLRDKLDNDELDLSMMSLTEVPVKEIAALPRATKIDLSSNQLTSLPFNFAQTLTNITHLELGSNKIKELPDNFYKLRNLKHLDLYHNQLTDLPLTFCQLPSLKWLDLKDNPLNSTLRKVAGDCLNHKECEAAARNVIAYLKKLQTEMEAERQQKAQREKERAEARARSEEEKLAKKRAEKKAAKEKKKAQTRAQLELQRTKANGIADPEEQYSVIPQPVNPQPKQNKAPTRGGWSLLGWFNLVLLLSLLGAGGTCLYVYTDGDFSQAAITAALPRILDNTNTLATLTLETLKIENLKQTAQSVSTTISETVTYLWAEIQEHTADLHVYLEPVMGAVASAWSWLREHTILGYNWVANNIDWVSIAQGLRDVFLFFYEQWLVICEELSRNETLTSLLETIRPYYEIVVERLCTLWGFVWQQLVLVVGYIQAQCPSVLDYLKTQGGALRQSLEGLVQ